MADIFISYKREDREWAEALSNALEAQGWSTWWDASLAAGESFDDVIETELNKAKCVVALWSAKSVKSRWVRTEAGEGLQREILVPVLIEKVKPPLAFRRIHTARLIGWNKRDTDGQFGQLVRDIRKILGPSPVALQEETRRKPERLEKKAQPKVSRTSSGLKQPGSRSPLLWSVVGITLAVAVVIAALNWRMPQTNEVGNLDSGETLPAETVPAEAVPSASFTASSEAITQGESTTLNWSASHATEIQILPDIGVVESGGSQTVSPEKTTTYRLIASGAGGEIEEMVTIKVSDPQSFSNSLGMEFTRIEAGSFSMGTNNGEEVESPVHRVTISKPFYMGVTEVTQGQWESVMRNNPSSIKAGKEHPVENVSWPMIQDFLEALNTQDRPYVYRLPTEAEWEYACRAGSQTAYYNGYNASELGRYVVYSENAGGSHSVVKSKLPNVWGLYDMSGNILEWTADWFGEDYYTSSPATDPKGPSTGRYRVLRGGSFVDLNNRFRCTLRWRFNPLGHGGSTGFRLVANPR